MGFSPFGVVHAITFVACAGVLVWCALAGYRAWVWDGRKGVGIEGGHVARARFGLLLACIVIQAANLIYFALPANRDLSQSLPLHLCDLAGLLAIAALAWPRVRTLSMLLYAWGVGLSTQAFFTPVVPTGPDTLRFHLFFVSHLAVVGPALFLIASRLYRPRAMDVLPAFALTALYGGLMIALNMSTGWNYGYVGNATPEKPTVIDALGPWPLRLLPLGAIILTLYAVIFVPWSIVGRRGRFGFSTEAQRR